jgi:hypothetical protein
MGDMLAEVAAKDGAFMEGYLLYTIGYFKALGFDTDYLMVVLGAKYMRAAGYGQPKNFDLFFGKMSDIARAIGLSMNVVSIYPLTIGISAEDPESGISTAMTFVKGMAHQGLEMASDGIFVRNMEGDDESSKISFKEIYPALSMTPVEGIRVENLAPAPTSKKRTSSVKTALFNRSEKATGKPARTVRYITGFAVLAIVAAVLAFSMAGDSGSVADTFSVDIEDADCGLVFYDSFGNEIEAPSEVEVNSVLLFSVEDGADIGYISDGLAFRLSPGNGGIYSVTVSSDLKLESLYEVSVPESATVQIYNFAEQVSDKRAYSYHGYYSADDYAAATGGMWVGAKAVMLVTAVDGMYISTSGEKADAVLWKTLLVRDPSMEGMEFKDMPSSYVTLSFNGDYSIDGNYVTGELEVVKGKTLNVTFGSAHATGTKILVTYDSGSTKEIDVKEDGNTFRLFYCFKDMTIDYKLGDFSRALYKPSEVRHVLPILREDLRGRQPPLLPLLRAGPELRRRHSVQAEGSAQGGRRHRRRRHGGAGLPPCVLRRRQRRSQRRPHREPGEQHHPQHGFQPLHRADRRLHHRPAERLPQQQRRADHLHRRFDSPGLLELCVGPAGRSQQYVQDGDQVGAGGQVDRSRRRIVLGHGLLLHQRG